VERDPDAARDIIRKTGQTGVPVIKIGSSWIVGFDRERIEKELAAGPLSTPAGDPPLSSHLLPVYSFS
jgi:hypothetical protein